MTTLYKIAAVTTFLSAFLLFQVQPLISKHILAWFGGGAMVWITALFFFMLFLFLGYLYVLVLSRAKIHIQKYIHGTVTAGVLLILYAHAKIWPSAITPVLTEGGVMTSDPVTAMLVVLTLSIGAPFFLLSTTSSLLQLWYGKTTGHEPFSLYAISNVGSLLGLLSYPFIFEPLFSTVQQGMVWSSLFVLYVVGLFTVGYLSRESGAQVAAESALRHPVTLRIFSKWAIVASVPVIVMLTSTNFISGFIAPVPLIWIAPLALYLISFIVSFRAGEREESVFTTALVAILCLGTLSVFIAVSVLKLPVILLLLWACVFSIAHYCHEWLYRNRPQINELPWFYVALSLGGVLGSAFVLLATLALFKTPIEFMLLVGIMLGVSLYELYGWSKTSTLVTRGRFFGLLGISVVVVLLLVYNEQEKRSQQIVVERNFYGAKSVIDEVVNPEGLTVRTLAHEATNHGFQYLNHEQTTKPTSYYTETSGIGRIWRVLQSRKESINVATIGLGTGTISTYCRPTDSLTFFEIDPQVVSIAQRDFSYLDTCPQHIIILGDARQEFTKNKATTPYDIILVDAYADDAAPVHLMTVEAAALYLSQLDPQGAIFFHISSRYLDLLPVIAGLAEAHNLTARYYFDREPAEYGVGSYWTALAPDPDTLQGEELSMLSDVIGVEPVYWTDTKNALLPVIRFRNTVVLEE